MTPVLAVEFEQGIEDAWSNVAEFVPKLVAFLVILIVGWLIAKAIAKAIDAVLERLGFDRAVERGGIKKALSKSQYDASDILSKIIFYALFLIVLQAAFGVFGPNPINDLLEGVIAYLPNVIAAIVIIVITAAIATAVKTLLENALGGLGYGRILANVAAGFIIAFGIFAALNQLQIAPEIVNGLYYAILALIVGSGIIAIGGGGIAPMRQQWERALTKIEEEAPKVREASQEASQRVERDAPQKAQQLGNDRPSDGSSSARTSPPR